MSKHILGIASTCYHLLTFLFVKDAFLKDEKVDLVLTDKTPFLYDIYQFGRLDKYFNHVFFADAKRIKNPYKSAPVTLWESFIYNKTTPLMLEAGTYKDFADYDEIYFASPGVPDEIVKEIIKTAIKRNRGVKLHRFEDGFASYTKPPVPAITTPSGQKMYKVLFHYDIKDMEKELYLFEPSLTEKNVQNAGFDLKQIPKNKERIQRVIAQIQDILHFESRDFDEKYMFLGQGTANGMFNPVTYRKLITDIAEHVGYDNFIVKPHPRGEHDQFDEQMKIYKDTCPFELAVANGSMEDKTLISYYSTACVSGILLFNSQSKIIFLYPLAGDSFNEKCDYEDYFHKLCDLSPNVHIAHTREELWALLDN